MKYPKWYIRIIVRIALALFDHINLKVVGFEPDDDRMIARLVSKAPHDEQCWHCGKTKFVYKLHHIGSFHWWCWVKVVFKYRGDIDRYLMETSE